MQLESLFDLARGRELLAQSTPALWNLTVREKAAALSIQARREMSLNAQEGWGRVEIVPATATRPLSIAWSDSSDAALRGVRVIATATPDARASAWRWNLSVKNENRNWGISRAVFPQLALADEGENTRALYPQGSGIAMKNPSARNLNYAMDYPFGWATMQMLAVYHGGSAPHGLYVAMHDPRASTKRINMVGDAAQSALQLNYEHPAPRIDEVAVDFQMGGQAVWQLLRGDWFDAAQIYKSWAQKNATWWPKLGKEGREDTPLWMRRLAGWGLIDVRHQPNFVESALSLRRDWGMPIGVHLYQWHQIPFDNDYPHYFPVRDAFPAGVKALQAQGVHAMPYINGRLWDTRDKGTEDFEYSARALPWATKVEKDGKLVAFTEKYGSKESNGSDVELAAMCPSTSFWQDELRRIVLRLTKEYGTDAVYMDQIAAAQPVLCRDPSHPHPAGGGDWWAPSYNEMLRKIRAELPAGKMLTTECNAEPYIKSFDGYLTWHWQYNEQVALFPAVYGGAIQMFGRAYGAGPDAARAMRMRAAQQLMWGEQIGWVNPEFVLQASGEAEFMRRVVKLRDSQARFFYAGAMARPPRLGNNLPQVTADWQWQGTQIVTTDAAMSGLWKIAGERKALLMVSNVSENPVEIALDTAALDVGTRAVQIAPLPVEGITVPALQRGINRLILPPRAVYAWNVSW